MPSSARLIEKVMIIVLVVWVMQSGRTFFWPDSDAGFQTASTVFIAVLALLTAIRTIARKNGNGADGGGDGPKP